MAKKLKNLVTFNPRLIVHIESVMTRYGIASKIIVFCVNSVFYLLRPFFRLAKVCYKHFIKKTFSALHRTLFKIRFPKFNKPLVSIIIPVYNQKTLFLYNRLFFSKWPDFLP